MIRKVVQIGDPILEKPTEDVKQNQIDSEEIKQLIKDLVDTCIHLRKRSAGLSANQIGEKYSICVCRRTDIEDKNEGKEINDSELWEVMINPKIVSSSKDESVYWEGCLSIGVEAKDTIYGPVWRPERIRIEYLTRSGQQVSLDAEGFFSHVVQHELDHLNGELFLAKVPNPQLNLWKSPKFDSYIDQHGEYPPIG